MLEILIIVLALGIVGLSIVTILIWKRMSRIAQPVETRITPAETEHKKEISEDKMPHSDDTLKIEQQTSAKQKIPKPKVPPDARIEQLVEIYSDVPGILGAIIADRFGQTIAADTNLVLDRIAIPAYFKEILELARNERMPIGKPQKMFICGEGSYWIFGEIAGMPWGIWLEHEIPIETGSTIADEFRSDAIKVLKNNYTRIW